MSQVAALQSQVEKAFVGHPDVIRKALVCFLGKGHLLIEDEPGVGKTLLAQAIARALGLEFRRIQMTPDLLPSDVTGSLLWIPQPGDFRFRPGPLFASIVLLDELNRASAKTQSAVLQAMEERKVTVDGVDHPLPQNFFVIATQNPFESAGVNVLPESQLDRFALKIKVGRVTREAEKQILISGDRDERLSRVEAPFNLNEITEIQNEVRKVTVSDAVLEHILKLAEKLRSERRSHLSTRAVQSLLRLAQAQALVSDRTFVLPEDVRDLAMDAWAHRARTPNPDEASRHVEEVLRETSVF